MKILDKIDEYLSEKFTVKYKMKKSDSKISVAEYSDIKDAKKFLESIKKDGGNGLISKNGKVIKEETIDEVMGYKMKAKDKKIIKAFIDGAKDGQGDSLWIEGDYLFGPMQSTKKQPVAQRTKDGEIVTGQAFGNVSQTWKNFINKNK